MNLDLRIPACLCSVSIVFGLHAQRVLPIGTGLAGGTGINDMVEYNGQLIIGGYFQTFNGHERWNLQGWDGAHHDYVGGFSSPINQVRGIGGV